MNNTSIQNSLLGTAVGDALGLPYEGLTPARAIRLLGYPDRFRFFFGRGMVSDDTEHATIVAQCLIASAGDDAVFERELARRLKRWFLALPAGIGLATLRACLNLWLGSGPHRSGVFSAGNGPSMRAAIIGVAVDSADQVLRLNHLSTRITHTDPIAEQGAAAVALAAWAASRGQCDDTASFFRLLRERLVGEHAEAFLQTIDQVEKSLAANEQTEQFAATLCGNRGVTGYTLHTVPVCLHAWLSHRGRPAEGLRCLIRCGGDTDSTAAVAGGIFGAENDISDELVKGIRDYPCSTGWIRRLSAQLTQVSETGIPQRPLQPFLPLQLLRNVVFASIVLAHGFRRLFPPY
ncbi:MAG: ADP-ribosylglycohydrolase family protein [Fuerstiella sp.]